MLDVGDSKDGVIGFSHRATIPEIYRQTPYSGGHPMMRWNWLVVGVLSGLCSSAWGGDKPQKSAEPESKAALTEKEIKALIDQLASSNPEPIINKRGFPSIDLPKGFDRKKQAKVRLARSKLVDLGPVAFPYLIESGNDKRYSQTTSNGLSGWYYNETVGVVCRTIILDQLQPYGYWQQVGDDPRSKPKRPSYPGHFLESQKLAKEWWEKNKDKSLYQMQLDVLDWIIVEEAKRPRDFTDKEKQYLEKLRKDLVKSGKPLPSGNYYANEEDYSN
jgi:hypothetical protein